MPSTKTHYGITKSIIGKEHPEVHSIIDGTTALPRGKLSQTSPLIDKSSHRKDAVHDIEYWKMLLLLDKITPDQYLAAWLHFESDKIDSSNNHLLDRLMNPDFEINRMKAKLLQT